ncbi:MAG: hypothetical protein ACOYY3_18255 [Chloroflexota bacterium]
MFKKFTKGETMPNPPILQLRVALTTSDYERLVKFYEEGAGGVGRECVAPEADALFHRVGCDALSAMP